MTSKNGNSEKDRRYRAVVRRDGEKCNRCGTTVDLTLDHIVPRSRGGSNRIVNLQILCRPCNQEKGDTVEPGALVPATRLRKHGLNVRLTGIGRVASVPPPRLEPRRGDGEAWEDYAHRLERRIKEQREHIKSLNDLRGTDGNRADRKRIRRLEAALGQMTLRWEDQLAATRGIAEVLRGRQGGSVQAVDAEGRAS